MLVLEVHAKPRAKQSAITEVNGKVVGVRLAAPPVDGAANDELVSFLAQVLGVPRRAVSLVRGASSRRKVIAVDGVDEDEAMARLRSAAP